MGPTASGKTDIAVGLVQRFPLEIISVDSAMVYRGMDIGTAKPAADVLAIAPHHLLDIRDPAEAYSAADFRTDALALIEAIHARDRIPLLVGGTFLYFRALEQGLSGMPAAAPDVRAGLEAEIETDGLDALYARLQAVDPVAAARIHASDPQRIIRALEIHTLTGEPISRLQAAGRSDPLPNPLLKLGLVPGDRNWLHRRIELRLEHMLTAGFETEARRLYERQDLQRELPAMRAVGYRQMWSFFDGEIPATELPQRIGAATRQYARRQLTWLRGETSLAGHDCVDDDVTDRVARQLDEWLELTAVKK